MFLCIVCVLVCDLPPPSFLAATTRPRDSMYPDENETVRLLLYLCMCAVSRDSQLQISTAGVSRTFHRLCFICVRVKYQTGTDCFYFLKHVAPRCTHSSVVCCTLRALSSTNEAVWFRFHQACFSVLHFQSDPSHANREC